MGKVTIYLDEATEQKARSAARAGGLPLSRWLAERIRRRVRGEWPAPVRELAGAWSDLPFAEQIRGPRAKDAPREHL